MESRKGATPFYPAALTRREALCYWYHRQLPRGVQHVASNAFSSFMRADRGETFVTARSRAVGGDRAWISDVVFLAISTPSATGAMPRFSRAVGILQQDEPDDYVLRGRTHSVREFVELAFARSTARSLQGEGVNEKGVDAKTGKVLVRIDPRFFRPTESICARRSAQGASEARLEAQDDLPRACGRDGRFRPEGGCGRGKPEGAP